MIGDFNLTLSVELDRLNTYYNNNKARDELEGIMDEFCLKDIWRNQNQEKREYSWRKKGDVFKASRIDFALVSGGLDQKVKNCMYLTGIQTDHRAFYMVVDLNQFERGTGYWKFNNSHLKEKEFIEVMNQELEQSLEATMYQQPQERWETIKRRIKKTASQYAREKAATRGIVIANLSEIVCEYETRLLHWTNRKITYMNKLNLTWKKNY